MENKEFTQKIDKAINLESLVITTYADHLKMAVGWSGLKKEEIQKIDQMLGKLKNESLLLVEILKKIKEAQK